MPRSLTPEEVDDFRERLVEVATKRFAERGYEGVTMRALAEEVGCSRMTPYRYFENKAEIFNAVRAAAFERLADAQDRGVRSSEDPIKRLHAIGAAYWRFAFEEPDAYRFMFELAQPDEAENEELTEQRERQHRTMLRVMEEIIDAGLIEGDANEVTHLFWAGLHGSVSLHLANKLTLGVSVDVLARSMVRVLFCGLGAERGASVLRFESFAPPAPREAAE